MKSSFTTEHENLSGVYMLSRGGTRARASESRAQRKLKMADDCEEFVRVKLIGN